MMQKKIIFIGAIIIFISVVWNLRTMVNDKGSITIYTSVPKDVVDKIVVHFENDYPDIDVEIYRESTGNIMDKIYDDIERTGKINADIIWIADPVNMEELAEKNLLLEYKPKDSGKVIPGFIDYRNLYTTTRLLLMAIVYHENSPEGIPASYQDLVSDRYSENLAVINYTSGSSQYTMCALTEKYGESFMAGIAENASFVARDNKDLIDRIAFEEAKAGIADLAQITKYMKAYPGRGIKYVLPEDGIIAVPSPIAIINTTSSPGASKRFIDWIISEDGQNSLSSLDTVPIRTDVPFPFDNLRITDLVIMTVRTDNIDKHKEFVGKQIDSITAE